MSKEEKTEFLFKKIYGRDFISLALKDKIFISRIVAINERLATESETQCIVNKINQDDYKITLKNQLKNIVVKSSESDFDLWSQNIEFLASSFQKSYLTPQEIDWDTSDVSKSTALTLFNDSEAKKLVELIHNPRLAPILMVIGFPLTDKDGKVYDLSFAQALIVDKYVTDAVILCGYGDK